MINEGINVLFIGLLCLRTVDVRIVDAVVYLSLSNVISLMYTLSDRTVEINISHSSILQSTCNKLWYCCV